VRHLAGLTLHARSTRRQLIADVRRHRCDVVNIHCISSNARYALALSTALRVPLVVSLHGELTGDADDVYRRSPYLRRAWRQSIQQAAAITAPSAHTLEQAELFFGRSLQERAQVIRNGVDVDLFNSAGRPVRDRIVVGVGRLVGVKGFDLLISAFARARHDLPNHRLVIAGDGPERRALEALADREAPGRVTFTGRLDEAELASLVGRACLYVLSSRQEALGLTALEAMAAGTPVLAARTGGVPEIVVDGKTGILFDAGNVPDLAGRIVAAVRDAPGSASRALRALETARHHSWSACVNSYSNLYESVIETREPERPTRCA